MNLIQSIFGVLFCLSMGLLPPILAQSAGKCELAPLNISEEIKSLSAKGSSPQNKYLHGLLEKYENCQNYPIFETLKALGDAIYDTFKKDHEEQWLLDSASALVNLSLLKLMKYAPVNADSLISRYKALGRNDPKHDIFKFWTNQVVSLDDFATLNQLIEFGVAAKLYSQENEDKDWIISAAGILVRKATSRITELDPFQQGVFEITMQSQGDYPPFDLMAVIDPNQDNGLVIQFTNTEKKMQNYSFRNVSFEEARFLRGTTLGEDYVILLNIEIDRDSRSISGTVTDSRYLTPIEFTGKQIINISDIFLTHNRSSFARTEGTYSGTLNGQPGQMILLKYEPHKFAATFISEDKRTKISFLGKLYREKGILSLVSRKGPGLKKLVLVLGDEKQWTGLMFSTTNDVGQTASFILKN